MATLESLLLAPAFASGTASTDDTPFMPPVVQDAVDLLLQTISKNNLVLLHEGVRIQEVRSLLERTVMHMIGTLPYELKRVEKNVQHNMFSLTANKAAKAWGNTDKKTVNGDSPLFDPNGNTLETHRQTLLTLYAGTGRDQNRYNRGFAPNAAYITSGQKTVMGYPDISKANEKNIAMAPPLHYPVNRLLASQNLSLYNLDNTLPNGVVFNMSALQGVIDKKYEVKADIIDLKDAESKVYWYMFSHPFKTIVRLAGCAGKDSVEPVELSTPHEPLPYSYNASDLANEAFFKREISVYKDEKSLTPAELLEEIESTADELSGEPLSAELKAFQGEIQRTQRLFTAFTAAKEYTETVLPAIEHDHPLFDPNAVTINNTHSLYRFLYLISDQGKVDSLIEMMADNVTYLDGGHFAATGKEDVAKYLLKHPLRTHPAEIEVDTRVIFRNMITSTQTYTLRNGEKFMVCHEVFLNEKGEISYLSEVYNRKAALQQIKNDSSS